MTECFRSVALVSIGRIPWIENRVWFLSILAASFVAICAIPAFGFSPDDQRTVGSRLDTRLDGYQPLSSRLTLEEAKTVIGGDAAETSCAIRTRPARCLTYLQIVGGLRHVATHYFVSGRNQVAIVSSAPVANDGVWTPLQYCDAVARAVLNGLIVLYGAPDQTNWPANYSFDPDLPPEWPTDLLGHKYRMQAARFTFPRGGEIRLEYIEFPGRSCMVRQIYYWGW